MPDSRPKFGIYIVFGVLALLGAWALLHRHRGDAPILVPVNDKTHHLSDSVAIHVYLDGSGSIKHFLQGESTADAHNYLGKLLDKCETTLKNAPGDAQEMKNGHLGWTQKAVTFWKFGKGRVTALAPEGGLQAMGRDLSQFAERSTLIETPIAANTAQGQDSKPEVKVIITDLYQIENEMDKPANALAARYLQSDNDAVDILAVRNPFSGVVEDLPGLPPGQSLANAANSMPFYVIVVGPAADVRHTIEVLKSGAGLDDALQKHRAAEFFFTRAILTDTDGKPDIVPEKETRQSTLAANPHLPGSLHVELRAGALQFMWHKRVHAPESVPVAGNETLVPKVSLLDSAGVMKEDKEKASAVSQCGPELCVRVDREKLGRSGTYFITVDRVAYAPAATLTPASTYLKPWNIEQPDAVRMARSGKAFADDRQFGTRAGLTPDLSKFLMALQGHMFQAPVRSATYYIEVQAK